MTHNTTTLAAAAQHGTQVDATLARDLVRELDRPQTPRDRALLELVRMAQLGATHEQLEQFAATIPAA